MLQLLAEIVNIIFLALAALAFAFYALMVLGMFFGAPFVPTSPKTVRDMIELSHIQKGELVYDLGSGDGRILIAAARAGAEARGWEIHPFLVWLTRFKVWWLKFGLQVQVYTKSYWTVNWKDADVIMVYLITSRMQEFKEKLLRDARPGVRVVSHAFKIPGWEPLAIKGDARLYIVPESNRISF